MTADGLVPLPAPGGAGPLSAYHARKARTVRIGAYRRPNPGGTALTWPGLVQVMIGGGVAAAAGLSAGMRAAVSFEDGARAGWMRIRPARPDERSYALHTNGGGPCLSVRPLSVRDAQAMAETEHAIDRAGIEPALLVRLPDWMRHALAQRMAGKSPLRAPGRPPTAPRGRRPITAADDGMIRKHAAAGMALHAIARMIGRCRSVVHRRAKQLGIVVPRGVAGRAARNDRAPMADGRIVWTEGEDAILTLAWRAGEDDAAIAKALRDFAGVERTAAAIRRHACKMGLAARGGRGGKARKPNFNAEGVAPPLRDDLRRCDALWRRALRGARFADAALKPRPWNPVVYDEVADHARVL